MADLLVEIGTEELPPRRVREAAAALRDGLAAALAEAGLLEGFRPEGAPVLGTPRRLAAFLPGVRERQPDRGERIWGPPVAAAFDGTGRPTRAGEGFARTVGAELPSLGRGEKVPGKPPYLYCDRVARGRSAAEVVAEVLPRVAASLPFRRTMRWPQSDAVFARPVRGLLVLLGEEVVPCRFAGAEAGRTVRGHAFLAPGPLAIARASVDLYRDALRAARVVVDWDERAAEIRARVLSERAAARGGDPGPWDEADEALLPEVAGLVEWPRALTGSFEERYLGLPPDLLATCMAHHLRYFPVLAAGGGLDRRFVSVTDREESQAAGIRGGNERVLRARLYDADFFFGNDRRRRLEEFRPGLAGVDFHRGLGTLLEKSERVRRACGSLCDALGLSPEARARADRAALLLKCDLLSEVVKEFPELQGLMGGHYAGLDGEDPAVGAALACQYLPAGPRLRRAVADGPAGEVAAVVYAADKADTLVAYFSIDEVPTGSADPFGLRRAALGLLEVLRVRGEAAAGGAPWDLSVEAVLEPSCREFGVPGEVRERILAFLRERLVALARGEGFTDFLEALGPGTALPLREYRSRLAALRELAGRPEWRAIVALVERAGNMAERSGAPPAAPLPPEVERVRAALGRARERAAGLRDRPVDFALSYAGELAGPVQEMFERILVDDPAEPARRAAIRDLLHGVFSLFAERLGDLRRLGSGARPPREP